MGIEQAQENPESQKLSDARLNEKLQKYAPGHFSKMEGEDIDDKKIAEASEKERIAYQENMKKGMMRKEERLH